VLRVSVKRIEITDAIAEIANSVDSNILQIGALGAQTLTDHLARLLDGGIGDTALHRGVVETALFVAHWILADWAGVDPRRNGTVTDREKQVDVSTV
jgi:hypothetical protein